MKQKATLLLVLFLLVIKFCATAQISGIVFKDFNFNGTRESSGFPTEPFAYGVLVKAYNAAGVQLGTTLTTGVNGAYNFTAVQIPAATPVRIEFTAPNGTFSAKAGTSQNGSSVQFATAPSSTINFAIASQDWYSNTANPYVATNGATNGDANTSGAGSPGANDNLYVFPYNMGDGAGTADDGGATRRLPNSQLGSVFGLAFQKTSRTLFMAAYLKRHVGFGPSGIGAIYKSSINATGVPSAATLLVNVSTIGINVGTDTHTGLPALSVTRNADPNTFAEVGKRGIGGIDVSDDGKDLYLVNMFEKKLHRINIGNPLKTSFTAADVTTWTITDPASGGLVWHPMACKTANGKVYVGGVLVLEKTTNHNLATDTVGARGIVYEFDPSTTVFTEVLRYPINYRRGFGNNDYRYPTKDNWWCGWQNNGGGLGTDPMQADYNTANGAFTGGIYYPQPMMSNIEFDVDGSMILGIRDRFGDQIGYQNVSTDNLPGAGGFVSSANNFFRGLTSGEVLRAGKNLSGLAYTLENRGQSTNLGVVTGTLDSEAPGNPAIGGSWSPTATGNAFGGLYGPGWGGTAGTIPGGGPNPGTQGGYFYFNHNFTTTGTGTNGVGAATTINGGVAAITSHYLKSIGGLALLAGSNEVIHNLMDPISTAYTNGVSRLINSGVNAGTMAQRLQLVATTTGSPGDPTNCGKSGGLGDIEILTDYQPIEVGNRIWNDVDGDGIQDAGEAGLSGVSVQLMGPGVDGILGNADDVVLATTSTDANGNYYFKTLTTQDSRKPVSWASVSDILPGFNYQIRIATNQSAITTPGYNITRSNAGANDEIDSDGTGEIVSSVVYSFVNFNTSNVNHSYDFGFTLLVLALHKLEASATLNNNTATISWITENETNTSRFYVERSTDNRIFTTVGNIAAAGNFAGIKNYSLQNDIIALLNTPVIYYRVKVVDVDGKITYSNIVAVRLSKIKEIKVWPNPVKDNISISIFSDIAANVDVRITDATGKTIEVIKYNIVKGNNQVNVSSLVGKAKGVYLLRIIDKAGDINFVQKITKE